MKLLKADFSRRIDLEGVGPTPRPADIDQAATGFADLVSLRIYQFLPGAPILGEAEGDEVVIVVLNGAMRIAVTGPNSADYQLQAATGPRAIYLPPAHHYALTPVTAVDVAYARARAKGDKRPRSFEARDGNGLLMGDASYGEHLEFSLQRLVPGEGLAAETSPRRPLPERLVHVQSAGPVSLTAQGHAETLGHWDSAALGKAEAATLAATQDTLVLLIGAH